VGFEPTGDVRRQVNRAHLDAIWTEGEGFEPLTDPVTVFFAWRSTARRSRRSARAPSPASGRSSKAGPAKTTLRVATPARVAVVPADAVDRAALEELAGRLPLLLG
jgi:hypothetical protein